MSQTMVQAEMVTDAVELACHAPSLHNTQPWRWVVRGATVDLFLDPDRIVTSTDGPGREALISCGAALHHFRVAMAASGWDSHIDEFPNPNNLDHLVSIDFTQTDYVSRARRAQADAIAERRTDRRPFRAPKSWPSLQPVLRSCLDPELVGLDVLSEDLRPSLAEVARLTESVRRYDDRYHEELGWWTSPSRTFEGIPESALPAIPGNGNVNREFPTPATGEQDADRSDDHAKIVLLSTPEDTRRDALNCGQALSAVLLECTIAGMATCPVTHITELAACRDMLRSLAGVRTAVPQVLIRVGISPSGPIPPATPRRPLNQILEVR